MVNTLRNLVLSRAQLRNLRTLGWVVGANASLKWVFNDLSHRWELVPWENNLRSSRPVQNTLTATELLEQMPRSVMHDGKTYTLHIELLRRGAVAYYVGDASVLGSDLPRPSLLAAAFDALVEILKMKRP